MTPEQKELKVEAFRAFITDRNTKLETAWSDSLKWDSNTRVEGGGWTNDDLLIRLAPPAEIPESEEARARRLLEDLALPEPCEPWEFLGSGYDSWEEEYRYAAINRDNKVGWIILPSHERPVGVSGLFYARARKLPTEKERAEAALNAYKLEPGERLGKIYEGDGIEGSHSRHYLHYSVTYGNVVRHFGRPANIGGYYAEIIKEPELVPFTQETFPLGAWVRSKARRLIQPLEISGDGIYAGSRYFPTDRPITFSELLEHGWEITTDSGTTWTRAGKGVGA